VVKNDSPHNAVSSCLCANECHVCEREHAREPMCARMRVCVRVQVQVQMRMQAHTRTLVRMWLSTETEGGARDRVRTCAHARVSE